MILGGLVVVALFAALIGPYFINWNDYKGTFEAEAEKILGQPVRVVGTASATLLPLPSLTFTQVDQFSNQVANVFVNALGLAVGTRVGLLLNNSIFTIPVDFGFAKARLSRVPLNARLSAAEQQQMLQGAGVSILLHGADLADRAHELAQAMPGL